MPARLSSLREKINILANGQLDYVICLKFSNLLAEMPAPQFAENYFFSLLNVKYLLIGEDFRFGHKRQGDLCLLQDLAKQHNSVVEAFPNFVIKSERVSSTKIREYLLAGQLNEASLLLGRNYGLCGRVIKGNEQARLWGVPTANIPLRRRSPALSGVFCVKVTRENGKEFNAVANLGRRPTLDGLNLLLEVHLFDCDANLYGEMLKVDFISKLRDERKFSSKEALIQQINEDLSIARAQLGLIS